MAFSDKELEEQLMEAGSRLASPSASVEELLPILDQMENFLSRIEQSPSDSMLTALDPARKALVAKELLGHSDLDVKVSVASCISEITRITAPEAPYEDDLMKEAFQLIVEAFGKLDDTTSRSHTKRISILETVAKVRSCVVMLDLECDSLILEMFRHFLKTIRPSHSESVFSSMETIMTLVIEESEDISSGLLSCLLHTVKKENKDVLPIAHRLAEKVISNSAAKLRPYLVELSQSVCFSLSEYSNVVLSICKKSAEALEEHDINASSECLADDSKLSERTVSDELPQGSVILEPEVVCPEEDGTAADKSPRSVMSNGTVRIENAESMVEPASPDLKPGHSHRSGQSNDAVVSVSTEAENLDSITMKPGSVQDKKLKKSRFQKVNSAKKSSASIHSQIENNQEVSALSRKKEIGAKEASANGPSDRIAESELRLGSEKKDEFQPAGSDNGAFSGDSPTNNVESSPDTARPRRGRPPSSKPGVKRGVGRVTADQSASGKKGALRNDQSAKESSSSDQDSKKESDDSSDSDGKGMKDSGRELHEDDSDDQIMAAETDIDVDKKVTSVAKAPRVTGKEESKREVTDRRTSGKRQKSKRKLRKGKPTFRKDAAELSLKDIVSSSSSATKVSSKDQNHLDESVKAKSRRKRSLGTEEISETQEYNELDETFVGSKVQVWWPDDKKFYVGVVDSFDPASKKHRIVYVDGDVENLLLKDELWKLIVDDSEADRGKAKGAQSNDTQEMQRKKRARRGSGSSQKLSKRGRPRKSDDVLEGDSSSVDLESGGKHGNNDMKRKRMRKHTGGTPKASSKFENSGNKTTKDDTPKTVSKSRDDKSRRKSKDESVTPKTASKSKDEPLNTDKNVKTYTPIASKSNDGTSKDGRKRKGVSTPGSGRSLKVNGASREKSKGQERGDSSSEKMPGSGAGIASKRRRKSGS